MIFSTYHDNAVEIDNGTKMGKKPLRIKLSTVCTGEYTDFIINIPKCAEIRRGKKELKNTGEAYTIRVFANN